MKALMKFWHLLRIKPEKYQCNECSGIFKKGQGEYTIREGSEVVEGLNGLLIKLEGDVILCADCEDRLFN